MSKKTYKELQEELTARIIAILESGQIPPWRKPWILDPNSGSPKNIVSKKNYRGSNIFSLGCTSLIGDYTSRWWGTYKQWQSLGGQVRKGEKSTTIIYWRIYDKETVDENGQKKKKKIFVHNYSPVFNLQQVEDVDGKLARFQIAPESERINPTNIDDDVFSNARIVIAESGAKITHGGNRAYYRVPQPIGSWPEHKTGDDITLPTPDQFVFPADYYGTCFHELGHWSEVRLGHTDEDNKQYAFNELRAEMTACFLSQQCEIPLGQIDGNHESYIANWLTKMKSDPTFLFQASKQAQSACQYMMKLAGLEEEIEEEPEEDTAVAA